VEEGLADALAMLANEDPRMNWTSRTAPGPAGYRADVMPAGADPNRYISEVRAAVANGFWELHMQLRNRGFNSGQAARLLLRWARVNRCRDGNDRTIDDPAVLLAELITVNGELIAEFGGNHNIDETILRESFRHCHFLKGVPFVRGDSNLDEEVNISDPILTLQHLFVGGLQPHACRDAMDTNDDRFLDVSDAIAVLNYLFLGAKPPHPPFPDCGLDPTTAGDHLCCAESLCPR
jgi:hypothetical protein